MKIICTDSTPLLLTELTMKLRRIFPDAEISGFWFIHDATSYAKNNPCDALITEIELYGSDTGGFALAEIAKEKNPNVKILFTTVCDADEYSSELLKLRPNGYLLKPHSEADLSAELESLRDPIN